MTFQDTCERLLKLCKNLHCAIAAPVENDAELQSVLCPPEIEYVEVDQ